MIWHQKKRPVLFLSPPEEKEQEFMFGENVPVLQKGAFGGLNHIKREKERRKKQLGVLFFFRPSLIKVGFSSACVTGSVSPRALRCAAVYIRASDRVARLSYFFIFSPSIISLERVASVEG